MPQPEKVSKFVKRYGLAALQANGYNVEAAQRALAHAALETGWANCEGAAAENSIFCKTNNLFGQGYFSDSQPGIQYASGTYSSTHPEAGTFQPGQFLQFRRPFDSFRAHRALMREGYPVAWTAPTAEQWAQGIAFSSYLAPQQDEDPTAARTRYKQQLLTNYDAIRSLLRKELLLLLGVAVGLFLVNYYAFKKLKYAALAAGAGLLLAYVIPRSSLFSKD